jgi:hypothetical protein
MNTRHFILKSKRKLCGAMAASLLIGISQTHATQTVRELFDKIGNSDYIRIHGLGSGATSVGLQGTWTISPEGSIDGTNVLSTGIVYKDSFSVDWPLANLQYGGILLGHNAGQVGCLNFNSGGNLDSLTDTNTGLPYTDFTSKSYAVRPLAPGAQINFQADGTYYFSVRIVKSYPWWVGDTAAGLGFSTGGNASSRFVGIGVTRSQLLADDMTTPITDATYLSVGTLGQTGFPNHPDDSSGPYFPVAHGVAGHWTNILAGARIDRNPESPTYLAFDGISAGLLLGKLTTSASGNATLSVKAYLPEAPVYTNIINGVTNITLEQDINNITWEATHNFTETSTMNHLLVWMHGQNVLEYDAIRVGTTYGDVIGFELIGAPVGSPANTVYEGVNVTISQNAGINSGSVPMSFQWRSNGVDIVDATNATLVLANPTTAYTANYSVTVSNYYGGPVTSPETLITINPGIKPYYVAQPQPVALTRYAGAPLAQFSVVVDGTPPFTYQWQHAGTNIGSPATTASVTNTLTLGPITAADAGLYTLIVTNAYGLTNSASATLTVLTPPANSYAAAVLSLANHPTNLFGYWPLDDAATMNDPVIREFWNGNNGVAHVSDMTFGRFTFGEAGVATPAFPSPHRATTLASGPTGNWQTPQGPYNNPWEVPFRLDLANLPSAQTNMTFTMWVKGGVRLSARAGYGQAYGLRNEAGNIRFVWGAYNATNGIRTLNWDTGLVPPADQWVFVALVVNGNSATVYMGSKTSFNSASSTDFGGFPDPQNGGLMTIVNSTTFNESNLRFGVGRTPIPWADDFNGAPWESTAGTWSDIAVFYQVLSPGQIKGLFLTGNGLWVEATPDGAGGLYLNWLAGFTLQEADQVTGPWTDIGAATPPNYYVPIATTGNKFYRVKPVSL